MNTYVPVPKKTGWLNRNVAGMAITSFLSDASHEMVTAVLPGFLNTIGVAAAALGWIEGASDAISSSVKLAAGWYSDRLGHRKTIVALGYFLTGSALSLFALAVSWPLVLIGRIVSWFGRGIRSPLRDAMLAESVDPAVRGKAFGLHRAGDTVGAVVGPLIGVMLLSLLPAPEPSAPFRTIFVLSLIPGLAAVVAFVSMVRETRRPRNEQLQFWQSLRDLPGSYKRFLTGVGLFGMGDFSHTLLILAATQLLTPRYGPVAAAQVAALLYAVRNVLYAGASFPVGVIADRIPSQKLLALGYFLGGLTSVGIAVLFVAATSKLAALAAVFALAGVYIAMEDALEGMIPADLVSLPLRGTAYGLMGTVNGAGDLVASVLVGTLWTAVSPVAAFLCAAALMWSGTALLWNNQTKSDL
jgi:MFS family permease